MVREETGPLTVGLGEILWDLLPGGKQLGGAPANFAYHANALGGSGVVASAIGDDALGQEISDVLGEYGLDLRYIAIDADHLTGRVTVDLDAAGKPRYVIHTDVAWDYIPMTSMLEDLAGRADAVCFGSLAQRSERSRHTIGRVLEGTRAECLRVFDINLRQAFYNEEIVRRSLDRADVLKLNDEELVVVARMLGLGGTEAEQLDRLLASFPLRAVALTKGAHGCMLRTRDERVEHRGFVPEAIGDTVGAGDAFTAALVLGLLANRPLAAIAEHANRVASYVCTQRGAMPPIPPELRMPL